MTDIEEILKKIQRLYERTDRATVDVPLALQAMGLAHFARDYIAAASILEREVPQFWLPILQLTGHAVELSLKACLASANSVPPSGHDLINSAVRLASRRVWLPSKFYRQSERRGGNSHCRRFHKT